MAILKDFCLDFPQIFPDKCWPSTSIRPYPFPSNLELNNVLSAILPLFSVYRKINTNINCVVMAQTVRNGTPE